MTRLRLLPLMLALSGAFSASCASTPKVAENPYSGIDRKEFNRLAVRLNLPLFWESDSNNNQAVDPAEVRALLFYPTAPRWTDDQGFTADFAAAFKAIKDEAGRTATDARRKLVDQDLDFGLPTIIYNDLRTLNAAERSFVTAMLKVSVKIDQLFAQQTGVDRLADRVPKDESDSQSLFRRNRGPKCRSPQLEKNAACSAIPGSPTNLFGIYPDSLQADPDFCQKLEKHKDARRLMDPFTVVREKEGQLVPVAYTEAYADRMQDIAKDLEAAAQGLGADEAPLKAYLTAAAGSFRSNDWTPADEAWSRMSVTNSHFYLRIAPDETYWEPCSRKAGFHMTFALINKDSLNWQNKLTPGLQQMENDIAQLIGAPYKARKVAFHLPDFIDIIINAGDDRNPFGLTIGQSLPNWGPVANEGRGRTVAMSNVYQDPDSRAMARQRAESLFAKDDLQYLSDRKDISIVNTILHEVNHNLGPSHEYSFKGKRDGELFGGQLASMLEELKAQTSGLYFVEDLKKRGFIDERTSQELYMDCVLWAFGHISQGMWTDRRERKAYSQLAAIQIGILLKEKALVYDPKGAAANGKDQGTFRIDFAKMPATLKMMAKEIGGIKAQGLKAKAEAYTRDYVDGNQEIRSVVTERFLRYPKQSFVYGVDL